MIKLKRVYETPDESDGFRLLVERLWPRGITKEKAAVALWMKDIAPSAELRKWFAHDEEKWQEFRRRYREEISASPSLDMLRELILQHPVITFVYAASDQQNSATVLKAFVEKAKPL
ncbi:MAG: DUF488 family protein [Pedobacter sp.]|nr:DUF488 family protein [Pedobacter sp.]